MFKYIKKIIKNILKKFLCSENNKIEKILKDFNCNFTLLDIGAAGGIHKRWSIIENIINVFCVEPQPESFSKIKNIKFNKIDKIFDKEKNLKKKLYLTNKNDTSSLLLPNVDYLQKFKNYSRFELKKTLELNTTTIDHEFEKTELDFVKIDVEGYHLNILEGSKKKLDNILGLEVEVELQDIRLGQPDFYKVLNFLKGYNFEMHDILNIIRWKRDSYQYTGQPHTCDLFFLKTPEFIIDEFQKGTIKEEKIFKYLIILSIYNRSDLISLINNKISNKLTKQTQINDLEVLIKNKDKKINLLRKTSLFFDNFLNNYI